MKYDFKTLTSIICNIYSGDNDVKYLRCFQFALEMKASI